MSKFGEWQPIETAPKDGRVILAYCPTTMDYMRIVPVRWHFLASHGDIWVDGNESAWGGLTHWMPLPQPPAREAQDER